MTKEELAEIIKLKKDIKRLQDELLELSYGDNKTIVTDKVKGSMAYHPYGARSFTLVGLEQMSEECIQSRNEIAKKLSDKYAEQLAKINKAINYINSITDTEISAIYGYRYIDGLEWAEIGKHMNYDESTVRRKCRTWEKKQQNRPSPPASKVI